MDKKQSKLSHFARRKVEHVGQLPLHATMSFFTPTKLASRIDSNDEESFSRAAEYAFVAATIFVLSKPVVASIVGAKISEMNLAELILDWLSEYLIVSVILCLPAAIFFFARRLTNLISIKYEDYLHCYAFFAGALIIAVTIFLSVTVVITRVFFGSAEDWRFDSGNKEFCPAGAYDMACVFSNALHREAAGLDLIFHEHAFSLIDSLFAINFFGFLLLLLLAFYCHLKILKKLLGINYRYTIVLYFLYLLVILPALVLVPLAMAQVWQTMRG